MAQLSATQPTDRGSRINRAAVRSPASWLYLAACFGAGLSAPLITKSSDNVAFFTLLAALLAGIASTCTF
jgi:hypothetical protein